MTKNVERVSYVWGTFHRASFHFLFKGQKKRARGTMIEVLQIKNEKKPERLTDMGFAQNRSAGVKAL